MKITLLHTDCMKYMAGLCDNAFDLAVVDPPYRDQHENAPIKIMRAAGSLKPFGNKPDSRFFWLHAPLA